MSAVSTPAPDAPAPEPRDCGAASGGPPKGALAFIFITVMLDALALGMVAPVLPRLIVDLVHGSHLSPRVMRHLPTNTVALAAVLVGLFNTVFALMQFFFSPVIGSLSDRFGRRPLILASNVGLGLNYLLMWWAPSLQWLFLGRLLSGITGASFGTASAFIADAVPSDRRAHAFGLLGAALGIGFILGPAVGGFLGEVHLRAPFAVAAAFSLANALYGMLVLPESLSLEHRAGFSWRRANPLGALGLLRRHPDLVGLSGVAFLNNLAQVALPTTVVLYAAHRFGWGTGTIGLTLGAAGVLLAAVQVLLLSPVVKRLGERWTALVGLGLGALGFVCIGLAPNSGAVWASLPVLSLWGLSGPPTQTLMTRHVGASEQGRLQGANASLTGLSELAGPLIFGAVFAYFVSPGQPIERAGAPFLLSAVLLVAAAGLGWASTRNETDMRRQG